MISPRRLSFLTLPANPLLACAVSLGLLLLVGSTSPAQQTSAEWPQFLGPQRDGHASATGLLRQWPAGGPQLIWKARTGAGMSGMAFAKDLLLTLGENEGQQCLIAVNALDGKPRYSVPIAPAYENAMGNGPRGTPTIHRGVAYVFTGDGVLAALAADTGKVLWKVDAIKATRGKIADYGMACSPLVAGDNVLVTLGAPGPSVAAFALADGGLAWQAGNDAAGYSSPILAEVRGKPQVITFAGASVLGLDTAGNVQWRLPFVTDYGCNTACPVVTDGKLLLSAGENHGAVLLDLRDPEPRELWSSLGAASVLRAEWQTPIVVDGKAYGMDNLGSAGPITHLTCIDLQDGKRLWRKTRFGKGNLIAADGKLWCSTIDGELVVVRISPERYEELGRGPYVGFTRQAPVIVGKRLYLKDDTGLIVCLDVAAK